MLTKLIIVNGINDDSAEPLGLEATFGQRLLGQLSKCVAIFLRRLGGYLQGAFNFRIVGCQENAPVRFHGQDAIAGFQSQTVGHVFGQRGTDGAAGLAKSHFLGHSRIVAY